MRPESVRRAFSGRWIAVDAERWQGRDYEVVLRPQVVAVVPVDREGRVTLVRQFRPPARRELLELPAGLVDEGETPLESARRELREETGLHGGAWQELKTFWTTPGLSTERLHLYLAEELEPGPRRPDEGEEIECVRWPREDVARGLDEIEDAKSLIGLLLFLRRTR